MLPPIQGYCSHAMKVMIAATGAGATGAGATRALKAIRATGATSPGSATINNYNCNNE